MELKGKLKENPKRFYMYMKSKRVAEERQVWLKISVCRFMDVSWDGSLWL